MNILKRPKSLSLAVILAVVGVGLWASTAHAHGVKYETYTAEAPAPFPSTAGCTGGAEGASKESHPFQVSVPGQLTVEMSEFTGDWDLYLLASNGATLASSTIGQPENPSIEKLSVALTANQAVTIVACNWSGGPLATVSFGFAGGIVVAVGDVAVYEGDAGARTAAFTVSLAEPSSSTITVAYATIDGSATSPADFTARSGTVSFPPGTASAIVKVPVTSDTFDEGTESFGLVLSAATSSIIGDDTGAGRILDDDPATTTSRLAIGDASVHEGHAGARAAVFNVGLSEPSTSTITVSFATAKGTASGTDFTAKTGTVSFAPGVTSMSVKVAITPDVLIEADENFTVMLSRASGGAIVNGIGLGTIIDDHGFDCPGACRP